MSDTTDMLPGVHLNTCELNMRWGDMDALGHLNNTGYLRYFEQARMEWYDSLQHQDFEIPGANIVIIDVHAEFRRPLVYPAAVRVEMHGSQPGNSSFMSHYAIFAQPPGQGSGISRPSQAASADPGVPGTATPYCVGRSKIVWVSADASASVPMPGTVRAMLTA